MFVSYYCRGKCCKETQHEIENFVEESKGNFAKLQCIKCTEPSFVVEYPQGAKAPDRLSRRVEGILVDDEQPTDICLH
jgi:hypothetical protein